VRVEGKTSSLFLLEKEKKKTLLAVLVYGLMLGGGGVPLNLKRRVPEQQEEKE